MSLLPHLHMSQSHKGENAKGIKFALIENRVLIKNHSQAKHVKRLMIPG